MVRAQITLFVTGARGLMTEKRALALAIKAGSQWEKAGRFAWRAAPERATED